MGRKRKKRVNGASDEKYLGIGTSILRLTKGGLV